MRQDRNEHMQIVKLILERKRQGTDCSEDESAELKQWVKRTIDPIAKEIIELFPQEFGEAIDEFEELNSEYQELADYADYVEGKLEMDEFPLVFKEWKELNESINDIPNNPL